MSLKMADNQLWSFKAVRLVVNTRLMVRDARCKLL